MGGIFGVVSKNNCIDDLFYCTDYHFHLGTKIGGLAVLSPEGFRKSLHSIEKDYFRSKLGPDLYELQGNSGIGAISDTDNQPLVIDSHLGTFGVVTVGKINNLDSLKEIAFNKGAIFSDVEKDGVGPTNLVAYLISQQENFKSGIESVQDLIDGSCSLLLLTQEGIYAARDKFGRTPIVIGKKNGSYAATFETCAFPTREFEIERFLGPGEIVLINPDGINNIKGPENKLSICSFLWVYYGFPASNYENKNVETVRYNCGAALARRDKSEGIKISAVAGIPDSGTGHAIGYANEIKISYKRPFVKYTPTWSRSFMPIDQEIRDMIAKMKLIPIKELIEDQDILFCEDSIVRGTQLQDNIISLYESGANSVHMRPNCPPLLFGCKYLNFSRSKSVLELAGRRAIKELEGDPNKDLYQYAEFGSEKYNAMVRRIEQRFGLDSLRYQNLNDLVGAIGLPKDKLCTYCWDSVE